MKRRIDTVFELLRTVLGAVPIAVFDSRTGEILWEKSPVRSCPYESEGID